MKILITGACGFIGFHLANQLLKSGNLVYGIDNLNNYYDVSLKRNRLNLLLESKNFKFFNADINNMPKNLNRADIAINLAAQPGIRLDNNEYFRYIHSNVSGFNSFLNFCVDRKINKILYASSSSVYGSLDKELFSESDTIGNQNSFYASTKVFNENLSQVYCKKHQLRIFGLRFFTVYTIWKARYGLLQIY